MKKLFKIFTLVVIFMFIATGAMAIGGGGGMSPTMWKKVGSILQPSTPNQDVEMVNLEVTGTLTGDVTGNCSGSSGTTGLAATATALVGNGANCDAGSYALGVNASGEAEGCTDATTEINSVVNALGGTGLTCADQSCSVDLGTAIDMSDETNLTAGRSLTESGDSILADAELYTHTKCIYFEDPTAEDDFKSIFVNKTANDWTLTELWAESDQTVTFMLQVDDGTPADIDSVDLAPAVGEAEDISLDGDTTLAADEEIDIDLVSVANTPTWVSICLTYTIND